MKRKIIKNNEKPKTKVTTRKRYKIRKNPQKIEARVNLAEVA